MSNKNEISEFPSVERIFGLLDKWRHLPAYQLERRADIFFALFLPEVLEKHCCIEIKDPFIPEFPIDKKQKNNEHRQADYFVLSEHRKRGILVELKTDMASKRSKNGKLQEEALVRATEKKGLGGLVTDIIDILKPPKEKRGNQKKQTRQKYIHLLSYLKRLELVCYEKEDELYRKALSPNSKGIYDILDQVQLASWVRDDEPDLEVLYIQPEKEEYDSEKGDKITALDFKTFADIVKEGQGNEELRKLFSECLTNWACTKAGSVDPRDLQS